MNEFSFQILSPEKVIYKGNIVSLVAPGLEGYFGVLAQHAPMLSALNAGEVKITEPGKDDIYFAVSGGILEVSRDEVVLLADSAERVDDIDIHRAREAMQRAEERLAKHDADTDMNRAQAALLRAITRLHIADKRRNSSS